MAQFGITRFGAYVPRLRIDRAIIANAHSWMAPSLKGHAKGSRAFTNWDEDAVTMAVEAGRDCLGTVDLEKVAQLHLASLSFPYADLQHASIVASALSLPPHLQTLDLSCSQRAGTAGLLGALQSRLPTLFIASDNPTGKPASSQEISFGAGAAALLLGNTDVIAKLIGSASISTPFVDHFRPAGSRHDYFWEERWVRDEGYQKIVPQAIAVALKNAEIDISNITHFVMPSLMRGAADMVAKSVGFVGKTADGLENGIGYAGSAHALLMLAKVFETARPKDKILLIGFGQGCDAIILEVTDAIEHGQPAQGVSRAVVDAIHTDSYMRLLSFSDSIDLEWGMRAEKNVKTALTEQFRSDSQVSGLIAGKCLSCGTFQFPQLSYCVNPQCTASSAQFEQHSLLNEPAKVLTYTADWLSYYQSPPMYVGFMQFENGARMLAEIVDVSSTGISVGTPLKLTYRIKDRDTARGYNRYFWKATPVLVSEG
jgi:3-hydroxy-3-methylglutaryl CoA synthase